MILYEDNHILLAHKAAGELTQPTEASPASLESKLKAMLKKRDHKPGNVFLHAVHRLDKPVSGIVLFAKSQKALERLNKMMREGFFTKKYQAIVEGNPKPAQGSLKAYLYHGDHRAIVVDSSHPQGKYSSLEYTVLNSLGGCSLLEVKIATGRYHQIRALLAFAGHPIMGDKKYGSSRQMQDIFLHHSQLGFVHPVTRQEMHIEDPLPENWRQQLIKTL